jgi:hypothetical protein
MERYEQPLALIQSIDDLARLSKQVADSEYYQGTSNAAQASVKLMIARELGLGITSISNIHLVKGKISLGYQILIALVKRSGKYDLRFVERSDERVVVDWFEDGEKVGQSKFDMQDAKNAGIGGDMYRKYPVRMLTARAISDGFNTFAPECAGGALYTPGELEDDYVAPRPIASARPQMASTETTPVAGEIVVDAEVTEADPVAVNDGRDPAPPEAEPSASVTNPTARVKAMLGSLTIAELEAVKEACLTLKLKATPKGVYDAFHKHAFDRETFLVAISDAINAHAQAEREAQEQNAEARTFEQSDEAKAGAAEFDAFKDAAQARWNGQQGALEAAGGFGK